MDTGSPTSVQILQNQQPPCTTSVVRPSIDAIQQIQAGLLEPAKHKVINIITIVINIITIVACTEMNVQIKLIW